MQKYFFSKSEICILIFLTHTQNGVSLDTLQSALDPSNLPVEEIRRSKQQLSQAFPQGIAPCGADALRLTLLLYMVCKSKTTCC